VREGKLRKFSKGVNCATANGGDREERNDLASRIAKMPRALTACELAALLNMGKTAVYEMAGTGRIPSLKIGATVRFDPARTAAWLRLHEVAGPEGRAA